MPGLFNTAYPARFRQGMMSGLSNYNSDLTILTTLRQLIDWAEQQFIASDLFFGHGADNALDEAAYLVLGALDLPFDLVREQLNVKVTETEQERIRKLVDERISSRKPAAYLLNKAWFAGLPFYVDERVLVPRSPIAELIRDGFSPWSKAPEVTRILDLGTGSGCIAIACALAFPPAIVDATDISPDALEVARINCEKHGLAQRVNLVESDLFSALGDNRYDIIVCNPPYVTDGEMAVLPAEYRHEPSLALAAGATGLDVVDRILADAHRHITPHGILVVEVGNGRTALEAKYSRTPFTWLDFEHGGEGVFVIRFIRARLIYPQMTQINADVFFGSY